MDGQRISRRLRQVYEALLEEYGPQHWWPAREPFEVIVGAILTQSTAWANVEKAIASLRAARKLSPAALRATGAAELADLIRSSGYCNVKAGRLKAFVDWFGREYGDSLDRLFDGDIESLRQRLLAVHGIGRETADSIILYTGERPTFVIDAYTRRIFQRLGLAPPADTYEAYRQFFMDNLPRDAQLFNEYHALIVRLGKDVCRTRPRCPSCCLNRRGGPAPAGIFPPFPCAPD